MDGDLVKTTDKLNDRVERLLTRQKLAGPTQRILIALAGVPGSGKTTISDALIRELKKNGILDVAVLPMVSISSRPQLRATTTSLTPNSPGWIPLYSYDSLFLPRP
jgi:Ni2+-binding GTPase involved in maturation of urease and hydrogenase